MYVFVHPPRAPLADRARKVENSETSCRITSIDRDVVTLR